MRLIDMSQPLYDNCPNCPAHPPVSIEVTSSHAKDGLDGWHMEQLNFTSHTGSHVDAPLHKLLGGRTIDDFPLENWTGPARIVDLRGIASRTEITAEMLAKALPERIEGDYVLIATGWGAIRAKTQEWLHDAPTISAEASRWLVKQKVRGVGIDHWSVGGAETHAILLGGPVLIVEELSFPEEVFSLQQPVEFWALPVNLRGHSGAPCRPVLVIR